MRAIALATSTFGYKIPITHNQKNTLPSFYFILFYIKKEIGNAPYGHGDTSMRQATVFYGAIIGTVFAL